LRVLALVSAVVAATSQAQAQSDPVADFYRGKTLTVLVGVGAGGEYDFQMRLVQRHIGKYIPGNPSTVGQNMVGATGLLMANHLYNVAPKDGTVIGLIQNGLPSFQAMGVEGINFDARKFNWIGSLSPTVETMAVRKGSGVKTVDDARKKDLIAGSNGRSGITYTFPALMNDLLGTRFKIVTGYASVNEINIAMERGEADGRNNSWTSWRTAKPDWITNKEINVLVDKQLLRLVTSGSRLGHPFATAPGVPPERVAALREAFAKMVRDPDYLRELAAVRLEANPQTGEQLQAIVDEVMATPDPVKQKGRKLIQ
jgi:tripartite-type tricarboxylate transporter receptor subunit TctC